MMEEVRVDATEQVLFAALLRREPVALEALYQRHGRAVLALARRVLRVDGAAEEVVQEVFIKLWDKPDVYDPDRGSLRSFLLRMAHGRAVDRIRSEVARNRRDQQHFEQRGDVVDDVESEAWQLIRRELLRDAMTDLSPDERAAISLAYFGGHSYREVAALLQQPEGTIKSRIRLGLNKLATVLESRGLGARP